MAPLPCPFQHREHQYALLTSLLFAECSTNIHIHGPSGTAKSSVIRHVLSSVQRYQQCSTANSILYALIDARIIVGKAVYANIIAQLHAQIEEIMERENAKKIIHDSAKSSQANIENVESNRSAQGIQRTQHKKRKRTQYAEKIMMLAGAKEHNTIGGVRMTYRDKLLDLARQIEALTVTFELRNKSIILVLDNADHLEIQGWNDLAEITRRRIQIVYITRAATQLYSPSTPPIRVPFQAYKLAELIEIVSQQINLMRIPMHRSDINGLVSAVVQAIGHVTRDPVAVLHRTRMLISSYCRARAALNIAESDDLSDEQMQKVLYLLRPHLQHLAVFDDITEHEIDLIPLSNKDLTEKNLWSHSNCSSTFSAVNSASMRLSTVSSSQSLDQELLRHLPMSAKYICVASFLASYNPPSHDKKLFVHDGPRKKARKDIVHKHAKAKISQIHIGPKHFTLDRMLSICRSICPENDANRLLSTAYQHISTLVALNILALRHGGTIGSHRGDLLDDVKLLFCLTMDEVLTISSSLKFDTIAYLYNDT